MTRFPTRGVFLSGQIIDDEIDDGNSIPGDELEDLTDVLVEIGSTLAAIRSTLETADRARSTATQDREIAVELGGSTTILIDRFECRSFGVWDST